MHMCRAVDATGEESEGLLSDGEQTPRSGSLVAGVSRSLLGAVSVPLTGALDLVSGVTSSIASTTGLARRSTVRHSARSAGMLLFPLLKASLHCMTLLTNGCGHNC